MDRRTELLVSAENAVRRRGYDGFSYADLAEDVGIRKASIHYHFPSKSDLAVALIERYSEAFLASLTEISACHQTASGCLAAYIDSYRHAMGSGDKLCLCVAFAISRDSLSDKALRQMDQFHSDSLFWLSGVFSRAAQDSGIAALGDPDSEAAAILALVEGAQLVARASRRVADFDRATALFRARLTI